MRFVCHSHFYAYNEVLLALLGSKWAKNGQTYNAINKNWLSIVGKNGTGKSTVIKLLCRLYQPYAVTIRTNGINLNDLIQNQLSEAFYVIFQDY
ncbi:MAG: ATP-binding cassette domain-containing protein [Oscillospiraceae bacterium]|nr:ATP-binding cassette domain-containing protein [Oscillospiraceae bacterium]